MRFSVRERRLLLATPGIGEVVVRRLESAGFVSIALMRDLGAAHVTDVMCQVVGGGSWANRRRAIERALVHVAPGARADEWPSAGAASAMAPRRRMLVPAD